MTTEVLAAEWKARRSAHERRTDTWLIPHLRRRQRGEKHPVDDFLFSYYSFRPAALRRWHPGLGRVLVGDAADFDTRGGYVVDTDRVWLDPVKVGARAAATRWIRDLLSATASRPPTLTCFGLHEWAMVYQQPAEEVRHAAVPLRLGPAETDAVVESHRLGCTHFDAFRFFTDAARPRNAISPRREHQQDNDQPGCLHATMDLYKWAYKLSPLTPSELVADCFALAQEVRRVDMAGSPYDLRHLGIQPIRVETSAGKATYVAHQRAFATRAAPLRRRLLDVCDRALSPDRGRTGGRRGPA